MLKRRWLVLFFCVISSYGFSNSFFSKEYMLRDLEHIYGVFALKYAPLAWKGEYKGWDLEEEMVRARDKVKAMQTPSVKEFQKILTDFFQSTADYHVSIQFYATAYSLLDFNIKSADGSYFIVDINRRYLPMSKFPFVEGDEILLFNNQPIGQVIKEFKETHFPGGNTKETDQALAESCFTKRFAAKGHDVPTGLVQLTIRKKNGTIQNHTMRWLSEHERIEEPSYKTTMNLHSKQGLWDEGGDNFFSRSMAIPDLQKTAHPLPTGQCSHTMGARTSFLSKLGSKTWSTPDANSFDAYIFKTPEGNNVGYVRIPHYGCNEEEAEEFVAIVKKMQGATDALIIDQLNNPGGSVFYLYAIASMLTDEPLATPKHRIALTQDDLFLAINTLDALETVSNVNDAKEVLGETFGGYPISMQFVKTLQGFCRFVVTEWQLGHTITSPTYLFGVDEIQPHPKARYTKPIFLLINALDFSGGDFFPAIMQDNERATIIGTRTAGAGGFVLRNRFYNKSAIQSFNVTGSLAVRPDGEPLENLGVQPDITLECTAFDMQNEYIEYKKKLLSIVDNVL